MKKRVYSLIAATLVFALIILMPFLLSLFLKDGNVIVLKGAVKGEGENLTEFPVYAGAGGLSRRNGQDPGKRTLCPVCS